MNVRELINFLGSFDPELPVVYSLFSEQVLLEEEDITVKELVVAREDGWVQDYRPDMETQLYLAFPGN